jgi:hypothetical protein
MTTIAPSSAKRIAVALPIPAAPPVIKHTLSFNLIIYSFVSFYNFKGNDLLDEVFDLTPVGEKDLLIRLHVARHTSITIDAIWLRLILHEPDQK